MPLSLRRSSEEAASLSIKVTLLETDSRKSGDGGVAGERLAYPKVITRKLRLDVVLRRER